MSLSVEDRVKRFIPWYYPYKIAKVKRENEPELDILGELVAPGSTAVDVGANRGYYSYALTKVAAHVEAFEPHPLLAQIAQKKLGSRVRVHEVALADREGVEKFRVPQNERGVDRHLGGHLGNLHATSKYAEYEVRVATLDSFAMENVSFIKIDAEGSELAVIKGAMHTIARWRPNLVIELLVGWYQSAAAIKTITGLIPYTPQILIGGCRMDAFEALAAHADSIKSANVLFVPKAGS